MCTTIRLVASLSLRLPHIGLSLLYTANSLAHSTKGTLSPRWIGALTCCELYGFRIYFTPLFGVLFTFPSQYLFTIGEKWYLVLEHDHPRFTPGFTCPTLLRNTNSLLLGFKIRDYHTLWSAFPGAFSYHFTKIIWVLQHPQSGFRLFPFRSPLLRESHSIYFPLVTKMFQFTSLPSLRFAQP